MAFFPGACHESSQRKPTPSHCLENQVQDPEPDTPSPPGEAPTHLCRPFWPTALFTDPLVLPLTRTSAGPLWSLSSASPCQLFLLSIQFWHISILRAHSELSPASGSSSFSIPNFHKTIFGTHSWGTYDFKCCVIITFRHVHFF